MEIKKYNTYLKRIVTRIEQITDGDFDFEVEVTKNGLFIYTEETYFKFQSEGVKGTKSGSSKAGYGYSKKMPPPSSFSKYTSDKSAQFAIAKSIQQEGIKAKDYISKINNDKEIESLVGDMVEEMVYDEIMQSNKK